MFTLRKNFSSIAVLFGSMTVFSVATYGHVTSNQDAGVFPNLATETGVTPYIADFNGDGFDDISLIRRNAGWNHLPIAFANGSGGWSAQTPSASATLNNLLQNPNTQIIPLEGRKDSLVLFCPEFSCPSSGKLSLITYSSASNSFVENNLISAFNNTVLKPGIKPLVGDFNGDGLKDLSFINTGSDSNTTLTSIPIAFKKQWNYLSNLQLPVPPSTTWKYTYEGDSTFIQAASSGNVDFLVADFNGDGKDDIALLDRANRWSHIKVAYANGTGGWNVTNHSVTSTPSWASQQGVKAFAEDYNGDGKADIALINTNSNSSWSGIRVIQSAPSGQAWKEFSKNLSNGFASWIRTPGVNTFSGNFSGDGRPGFALTNSHSGTTTLPIASGDNNGVFNTSNNPADEWTSYATSDTWHLKGDFNNDNLDDFVLIKKSIGWSTVPILFNGGNTLKVITFNVKMNGSDHMADRKNKLIDTDISKWRDRNHGNKRHFFLKKADVIVFTEMFSPDERRAIIDHYKSTYPYYTPVINEPVISRYNSVSNGGQYSDQCTVGLTTPGCRLWTGYNQPKGEELYGHRVSNGWDDGGVVIMSRYPIKQAYQAAYKHVPTNDNKGAAFVEIEKDGSRFYVFGTHISHAGTQIEDNINDLNTFIEELKTDKKILNAIPIIITGDWNVDREGSDDPDCSTTLPYSSHRNSSLTEHQEYCYIVQQLELVPPHNVEHYGDGTGDNGSLVRSHFGAPTNHYYVNKYTSSDNELLDYVMFQRDSANPNRPNPFNINRFSRYYLMDTIVAKTNDATNEHSSEFSDHYPVLAEPLISK